MRRVIEQKVKNENIAVLDVTPSAKGKAIMVYGKSGVKGDSGAKALGGLSTDPGDPVTKDMIIEGTIP